MALSPSVTLRAATLEDAPMLVRWDREPHVIACSSDDPDAEVAFGGIEWAEEIAASAHDSHYLIAEADGVPVGVMQVCDPHTEPTQYWGEIEPGLRAVDIWIGPAEWLSRGVGTQMMTQMIDRCFAEPGVTAIVIDPLNTNVDAQRFYRRLGFQVVGRRMFHEDDCLIMRLERADWLVIPAEAKRRARAFVIPAEAKRRAGTAEPKLSPGPATEPGQTQIAADLSDPSPGSTLTGRPGASISAAIRPGSTLRSGPDDKGLGSQT